MSALAATATCDHCARCVPLAPPGPVQLVVDVTGHKTDLVTNMFVVDRLRTRRHWAFCSTDCLYAWWTEPTPEPFHEVRPLAETPCDFAEEDRHLRITGWVVANGGAPALLSDVKFLTPRELNAWWRT